MYSSVLSGAVRGVVPYMMNVEVDASDGLPQLNMVGFISSDVKEAGERVKVAIKNSGILLEPRKVTVNLSPAGIRKSGISVDLPMAVGMLIAHGELREDSIDDTMIIGELGLDGEVKKIKGVLPITSCARENGIKTIILPKENEAEAAVVGDIKVIGVSSLAEVIGYLSCDRQERDLMIEPATPIDFDNLLQESHRDDLDFADINGQSAVKRAAEIAVAGFHHILIVGPPGSGKSMIAQRLSTIMPPLSKDESMEVSTIYSVSGLLGPEDSLLVRRPIIMPHHTITDSALIGGGNYPRPGAISLAHRGVLFLDEMTEFKRSVIDLMRQPMEEKKIRIARHGGNYTFPADFQLVGAMNPCPCGYYPDRNRCRCTESEIHRYLSHISGPILDRIDLCIEAPKVDFKDVSAARSANETSADIRARVMRVRQIQNERFKGMKIRFNSEMSPMDISKFCRLGFKEHRTMEKLYASMQLSARSYHKILRVARTIADLDGCSDIQDVHLMEAAVYRMSDGKYWSNET